MRKQKVKRRKEPFLTLKQAITFILRRAQSEGELPLILIYSLKEKRDDKGNPTCLVFPQAQDERDRRCVKKRPGLAEGPGLDHYQAGERL